MIFIGSVILKLSEPKAEFTCEASSAPQIYYCFDYIDGSFFSQSQLANDLSKQLKLIASIINALTGRQGKQFQTL